jgi:sulfatase maturation enzyme AslB (radical SAM superfamily)
MLTGYCATCKYAAICRGGCYRAATLNGGRCNPYCLYRFEKEGFSSEYQKRTNFTKQELFDMYNPIREMPKEYLQGEI